jgi:HEAT repeat protein
MRDVLGAGLRAVGPPAVGHLHARLAGSKDLDERADAVLLLAGFGAGAAGSVPLLAAEVADPADPRARHVLRCAAAYALGEIGVASPAAVEALARVAGDRAEPQSLRTYSAEALMDLGPAAAAAVPVLERLLRDESEDDDLRHFAWSALKSVGAASREHPCGGTVAGHMRSLYRAGGPSEADGPGSGG